MHRTSQVESGEVFHAIEPSDWRLALHRSGRNPGGLSAFLLLDDVGLRRRWSGGSSRAWRDTSGAARRVLERLAAEHALQERGGLDQLARTREARGLANYVLDSASHSPCSVGESGLDRGSGVKGTQHRDRSNGGAGQLGGDVVGDGREAQHVDVQHLAGARAASRSSRL